ncbi:uncharacterized protein PRCAT00001830001, partial [Priceomyces carsonii]|uniref:uncharacterized protein n=1 Tax=Priceomyces carsonii TaxID=28549 RepID=UPI002ED7A70A
MALRQLPFSITCRNFLFNIKHYKPLRCRPSFRASNHPFCTNRQLLEASYSQWILRATRDIAPKILKEASRNTDLPRNDKGIEDNRFLNVVASATGGTNVLSHVQNPQSLPLDDSFFECNDDHKTGSSGRNISRFDHTSDLIRGKNIASIVEELILSNNKEAIAQSDILNTIVNEVLRQAPPKSLIENNNEIDVPFNQSHKNPEHLSSFYTYIYGKIPHLYNLFHTYEPYMRNSKTFQENYIWLCYHMNDIDSIQEIAFTYFGNQSYNSKTLSYIMSGFILNYEVEFSKNLFSNLISLGRPMEPVLLDVVVSLLVQVDSLFETLTFVLSKWRDSKICSPPSPKAMALLSTEYAKYGTAEEIHNLNDVVATSASPDHFLIKLAQLKNNIKSRDPNNFKKRILDSDLSTINLISE